MYDKFPHPRINAKDTDGKIGEILDYLILFIESLEFELSEMKEDMDKMKKEIVNNTHLDDE